MLLTFHLQLLQIKDKFYIYLEFVYPGSINKYARDYIGAITEPVVRNFTRHILTGLAYLHSKGAIHRFGVLLKSLIYHKYLIWINTLAQNTLCFFKLCPR